MKRIAGPLLLAFLAVSLQAEAARVGSAEIDAASRSVIVTGWVNQTQGMIELLACGPAGKTHESVLVLDVNPLDLQTALLLVGLKPGTPPESLGRGTPRGTEVDLWVEWTEGTNRVSLRAECLARNLETGEPLPVTPWIFTGSTMEDGKFMALAEDSLVATFWDPWALINLPLPDGSNDEAFAVNTNTVPPARTPVRLRITAR